MRVRVALAEKDPRIVPEMGVRVRFLETRTEPAPARPLLTGVLVPKTAVVERDGKSVVFVVEGDRAKLREVTAGATIADFSNITNGLAAGANVIVSPSIELTDSVLVQKQ